jgi:hypothetical protein
MGLLAGIFGYYGAVIERESPLLAGSERVLIDVARQTPMPICTGLTQTCATPTKWLKRARQGSVRDGNKLMLFTRGKRDDAKAADV